MRGVPSDPVKAAARNAKISAANKGKIRTAETKAKISASRMGIGVAPWNKGKTGVYSAATLVKMSATRKGQTPWHKGRTGVYSPETRARMSAAKIGGVGPARHGHTRGAAVSLTYMTWKAMVQRCTNPKHISWKYYGGRGIAVCERWMVFENFLVDMGEKLVGLSIDRKDNDQGYFKDNCRWATPKEQRQNQRSKASDSSRPAVGPEEEIEVLGLWDRIVDSQIKSNEEA